MRFLDQKISPLGLGCWPIGGEMYSESGQSLGYANTDDKSAMDTIMAARLNGISLFDTAAAYGTGHSERLLAKGLANHSDALVVTKIGIGINEETKTLLGPEVEPSAVIPAIQQCLARLNRDRVDVVLLHLNSLEINQADLLFDRMERAKEQGLIQAYGWSTDFVDRANSQQSREGFIAIEHAMNVLMDAPRMQRLIDKNHWHALIRSPLAMGLLSGKYGLGTHLKSNDIRATNQGWVNYYIDGKPNPEYVSRLHAIREILQQGERTLVQGALGWLWAKSATNIPLPGARSVAQVEEIAGALSLGPLSQVAVEEIAQIVGDFGVSEGDSER